MSPLSSTLKMPPHPAATMAAHLSRFRLLAITLPCISLKHTNLAEFEHPRAGGRESFSPRLVPGRHRKSGNCTKFETPSHGGTRPSYAGGSVFPAAEDK